MIGRTEKRCCGAEGIAPQSKHFNMPNRKADRRLVKKSLRNAENRAWRNEQ